jgi:hypothetical protein
VLIDMRAQKAGTWQKARLSESRGMCVEVARIGEAIAVRHSVTPDDGALLYTRDEFAAFVDGCRNGEFDHLL